MKYVNVEEFDVNCPDKAPLKDFFLMTGGILAAIFIIVWASVFFADKIIVSFSTETSLKMENQIIKILHLNTKDKNSFEDVNLEKKVNFLAQNEQKLSKRKFKVFVVKNKQVNAFAVPGGSIFLTNSLLKEIKSEKEINFVLAHELGHFANKDHLRLLGRQLILIGLSIAFLGENSSVTNFLVNWAEKMELKYSQKQELDADYFAVNLLYKNYGDTSSGIAFMKRILKKNKHDKLTYFFATHPHPEDRIRFMEKQIQEYR